MSRYAAFAVLLALVLDTESHGAVLSGQFVPQPAGDHIYLTEVGAMDWVHWGYDGTNATRKWLTPVIGDLAVIGTNLAQQVPAEVGFSWTDGTPIPFETNIFTTVAVAGETNGFSLSLPADTSLKKLYIYAGAFAATAQVEVSLDDGLTPSYVDSSLNSLGVTNGYYLVDFAAAKNNDVLTIRVTAADLHETNGYVSLHAVALTTNAAPVVDIVSPLSEMNMASGETITVSASGFDLDGYVTNIQFFAGELMIGEASTVPFSVVWTETNLGPHELTAIATDNNGGQSVSAPITVFVTGTNGAVIPQFTTAPATVNLTAEGVSDWVHWGLYTENSVDRKSGVAPQISTYTIIGEDSPYSYGDNFTAFSWTDGDPNTMIAGTSTGVYVVGLANGFQITTPADLNPRTLNIYVGTFAARGKFKAALSDYSAPVFIDRSVDNFANGPASIYTLHYAAASEGQTLTVTFTCDEMYDGYGNVTLQAATLVSTVNPLFLSLSAPTNNTAFVAPATVPLRASLSGGDGSARTVEFYSSTTKIGQDATAPYTFDWAGVPPGEYVVTAQTTNNLGVVQSSDPVRIFVVGTGGILVGGFSPASGSVDLTAEGASDWVHWGLLRKSSLNRKVSVLPQISNFSEIGKGQMDQYGDNLVSFNWNDGTPEPVIAGTTTGLFVDGLGSGFEISVPADETLRRLKVYAGLYGARGAFEATLSDFSSAPFIHSSFQSVYNSVTAVYTIEFAAASPGQTLRVRYTSDSLFDEAYGNVTLQAATLCSLSPVVRPAPNQGGGPIHLSFATEVGWNYLLEYTESLANPAWFPLTNALGTGAPLSFVDSPSSATNRFYRIRMSK